MKAHAEKKVITCRSYIWSQGFIFQLTRGFKCIISGKDESYNYSREDIDRAKKRGRAYLCTTCYHKSDKQTRKIDEKGRIEEHILRTHLAPGRRPYYCTMCLFRCTRREQLTHHVDNYQRHIDMASSRQITDSSLWLVESPNPYRIGDLDYVKLSQEESLKFYLE